MESAVVDKGGAGKWITSFVQVSVRYRVPSEREKGREAIATPIAEETSGLA